MFDLEKFKRDMDVAERACGILVDPEPETNRLNGDASEYLPESPDDLPGNEEPWPDDATPHKKEMLPPIVDASEFLAEPCPLPDILIDGIIHKGTKLVIGGDSKSFKTWIQLQMALCVCSGVDWIGRKVTKGRVLYINFEIKPPFFQRRISRACEALGIKLEKGMLEIWNLRGYAASYEVILPEIIKRIKELNYALIILDPIYKIYGSGMKDENSAAEVGKMMNSLETVCMETGAAIIFGAHYSKGNQSAKEAIDRISGSGVYARDPDTILNFTKHQEQGCFTVETTLRNLPPIEPFVVRWDYPCMYVDSDLDPTKLKKNNAGKKREYSNLQLLEMIRLRTKNNPISISDWALDGNVKRQTLTGYLPELRQLGYIATIGEGTSSLQYLTSKGVDFINL